MSLRTQGSPWESCGQSSKVLSSPERSEKFAIFLKHMLYTQLSAVALQIVITQLP